MKKKIIIPVVVVIALALVLFLPIPQGMYKDGGTREYAALTYKIVKWNKIVDEVDENGQAVYNINIYKNTSVFWFPDNYKSIDELWQIEKAKLNNKQSNQCIKVWSMGADYEANTKQSNAYRDIWNSLKWEEKDKLSSYDYIFYDGDISIYYDSVSGIFYDMTNNRSATLSEKTNDEVKNSFKNLTFIRSNGDIVD